MLFNDKKQKSQLTRAYMNWDLFSFHNQKSRLSVAGIGLGHCNINDKILYFPWPFSQSHPMDATAPGIISQFQVGKKRKAWGQTHLSL